MPFVFQQELFAFEVLASSYGKPVPLHRTIHAKMSWSASMNLGTCKYYEKGQAVGTLSVVFAVDECSGMQAARPSRMPRHCPCFVLASWVRYGQG